MRDADWAILEAARRGLSDDAGAAVAAVAQSPMLQGLVRRILTEWMVPYGEREVRLAVEYQDRRPVLTRILSSQVVEEKLR